MKRHPVVAALFLALATSAFAHPGHDGDHDLIWDFSHLAAHPLATLGCALVLGTAAWLGWRALRTPPAHQAAPVKVVRRDR